MDDCPTEGEDYDGVLDGDGCPDAPGQDYDGDGFTDDNEVLRIGTLADQRCGSDWPANLTNGAGSVDRITLTDVTSFIAPTYRLSTSVNDNPPSGYSPRWDLKTVPANQVGIINLLDLTSITAPDTSTSTPPMFGGARAFNGPVCTPGP